MQVPVLARRIKWSPCSSSQTIGAGSRVEHPWNIIQAAKYVLLCIIKGKSDLRFHGEKKRGGGKEGEESVGR